MADVESQAESKLVPAGQVSTWLTENGFDHESLSPDVNGVEIIKVEIGRAHV